MSGINNAANQFQGYWPFVADDSTHYGSFKVYYFDSIDKTNLRYQLEDNGYNTDEIEEALLPCGWYWRSEVPGCLPDSLDPNGPFNTSRQAWLDARENG